MHVTDRIRFLYLATLSKPAIDRPLYRAIRRHRIRRILELGVGTGRRAVRMIQLAGLHAPLDDVHYTGVDLFEARDPAEGPGITLKAAHRLLTATRARVRLIPGDPFLALSRAANTLPGTELVVISAGHDPDLLAGAWFYLPRTLAGDAHVLIERPLVPGGRGALQPIGRDRIEQLAAAASRRRAA